MIETKIVNVVATTNLNQKVNLNELGKLREFLYDSKRYGGRVAYFKSSRMKGKVSIFQSGKMISIGTTSQEQAFLELEQTRNLLFKKHVIHSSASSLPIVHNIVALADLGHYIDLEKISEELRMIYEPEQFPGGIINIRQPIKATILLFSSGKAVILGLKNSAEISQILKKLSDITKTNQ